MNKLIIADDEGKTTVVPLVRDEITIGRKEGNTIRLTERNVSRRHACLKRANGMFVVEDLESYNGVRVNGEPIEQPQSVKDGDRITIGDYQLSLRSDRPAAGPAVGGDIADAEPPPYARLVMLGPPNPGREFSLEEGELVIGRTDENAIVVNHRSISRSHAKIVVSETGCRLVDLDSANGVRVNGTDFSDVELNSGDLVELGTVRLRFVGPNELYQFDADATVQMDAVPEDILEELEGRKSYVPIIAAIVVVALIAIGVIVLLFTGGDDGTEPVVVENPSAGETQSKAGVQSPLGPNPGEVKSRARDLYQEERYSAAKAVLAGLGDVLDDEGRELMRRCDEEQAALELWQRACNQADPGDLETIHGNCVRIKSDSRYYKRDCCKNSGEKLGESRIDAAKSLMRERQFSKAASAANEVAGDDTIPDTIREQARTLAARAEKRADAIAAREAGSPPSPRSPTKRPDRGDRQPTKERGSAKNSNRPSVEEAMSAARAAVVRNDQAACIRALIRAPRTNRVVTTLISCYQRSGNIGAACNLAQRYERYPAARQFSQARCR